MEPFPIFFELRVSNRGFGVRLVVSGKNESEEILVNVVTDTVMECRVVCSLVLICHELHDSSWRRWSFWYDHGAHVHFA